MPFVVHPSPAVHSAAAQAVGRHGSPGDIVTPTARCPGEPRRGGTSSWSRRAALSIRQHLGTWDRVHADLVAINGDDSDLAVAALSDLLSWLAHGAATSYGRPGTDQAAEIARLLATHRLTVKQQREIAFVVGIRTAKTSLTIGCSGLFHPLLSVPPLAAQRSVDPGAAARRVAGRRPERGRAGRAGPARRARARAVRRFRSGHRPPARSALPAARKPRCRHPPHRQPASPPCS